VHPADKEFLGDWVLVTSPRLSAPMRVSAKTHVPRNHVRLAYAPRRLLALNERDAVVCQPIVHEAETRRQRLSGMAIRLFEWIFGAPPVPLRATEGLIGDEGLPIVRVDATALDFLGVDSGDQVVVTWARRRARARVLLHTDVTRTIMEEQLRETTGAQLRIRAGDITTRLNSPQHLRVWVSARIRNDLQMPSDSVLRVRRSLRHLMVKNLPQLPIPLTGLVLAAWAIPDLKAKWLAVAVLMAVVLLALMPPLRRR
jgi:hypothetical protein